MAHNGGGTAMLAWTEAAWEDYLRSQRGDRKTLRRINSLIEATMRTPFEGIGKPEALRANLPCNKHQRERSDRRWLLHGRSAWHWAGGGAGAERTRGTGHGYGALAGYWSRRIDKTNRLVYAVEGGVITIVSCRFHYGTERR